MKLNKQKCREFADPGLKFSQNRGILNAPQIEYIVCTAIKIIDHHRTLVLYVYSRKQIANGNFQPCYTVFQTKDDYITLSRREDGGTTWRKSAFDNLDSSYSFSDVCAFYSVQHETCVSSYFNNDTNVGFEPLIKAQNTILEHRQKQRRIAREKNISAHMVGIPTLPRGLKSWIKSIMPAYFFYDYERKAKTVSGTCSACGHKITLSDVKQGSKAICPHCGHELTAKPRSRRGHNMYDRDTFEVIQNMGDGRLAIRIIKARFSYTYTTNVPIVEIYENIRQFISLDTNGKFCTEHYYYANNSGITTDWRKGTRPKYIMYQQQFEAVTCGHLYTKNLPDALLGTPWQYCTIADFYLHFRERMQALPFLREYLEMCIELDYDMKNSFVLYPKDLQKSHDRVQKRFKIKENELLIQNFKTAVQDARERFSFESDGMKIVFPKTLRDLVAEGNALHHCVGGYTGRVAKKECVILFLHQCADDTQPFFTIEVAGQEIIQVRGFGNCTPTPKVQQFITAWQQHVLDKLESSVTCATALIGWCLPKTTK